MKLSFSKKHKLILLVGILLVLLLFVIGQFYMLSPLKSDLTMKEQTLASEQKLLETITQKKLDATNETKKVTEDTRELQKKVPVMPLQEQFILDLEKAENVSNSKITTMSFSKDIDVTMETAQTGTENPPAAENAQGTSESAVPTVQEEMAAEQAAAAVPQTALKKLSVSLSVESPTYEAIEKFIGTLESLNRIVVVESINYSGGEEITTLEQEKKPLTYSLTVSAYYLPTLNDLIAELPKIDAPAPANKKNPLSVSADVQENN